MASTPFTNLLLYEDLIWKINLDISKNRQECGKVKTPHDGQRKFLMEREAGSESLNNALPGQKLCRQCLTEYEKLTKPNENKNMIENFQTESPQDDLASDDFLLYESPKEKLDSTLESIGVSPVIIHEVAQHSQASNANGKLKKVLNVFKENISAAHVSDIERRN